MPAAAVCVITDAPPLAPVVLPCAHVVDAPALVAYAACDASKTARAAATGSVAAATLQLPCPCCTQPVTWRPFGLRIATWLVTGLEAGEDGEAAHSDWEGAADTAWRVEVLQALLDAVPRAAVCRVRADPAVWSAAQALGIGDWGGTSAQSQLAAAAEAWLRLVWPERAVRLFGGELPAAAEEEGEGEGAAAAPPQLHITEWYNVVDGGLPHQDAAKLLGWGETRPADAAAAARWQDPTVSTEDAAAGLAARPPAAAHMALLHATRRRRLLEALQRWPSSARWWRRLRQALQHDPWWSHSLLPEAACVVLAGFLQPRSLLRGGTDVCVWLAGLDGCAAPVPWAPETLHGTCLRLGVQPPPSAAACVAAWLAPRPHSVPAPPAPPPSNTPAPAATGWLAAELRLQLVTAQQAASIAAVMGVGVVLTAAASVLAAGAMLAAAIVELVPLLSQQSPLLAVGGLLLVLLVLLVLTAAATVPLDTAAQLLRARVARLGTSFVREGPGALLENMQVAVRAPLRGAAPLLGLPHVTEAALWYAVAAVCAATPFLCCHNPWQAAAAAAVAAAGAWVLGPLAAHAVARQVALRRSLLEAGRVPMLLVSGLGVVCVAAAGVGLQAAATLLLGTVLHTAPEPRLLRACSTVLLLALQVHMAQAVVVRAAAVVADVHVTAVAAAERQCLSWDLLRLPRMQRQWSDMMGRLAERTFSVMGVPLLAPLPHHIMLPHQPPLLDPVWWVAGPPQQPPLPQLHYRGADAAVQQREWQLPWGVTQVARWQVGDESEALTRPCDLAEVARLLLPCRTELPGAVLQLGQARPAVHVWWRACTCLLCVYGLATLTLAALPTVAALQQRVWRLLPLLPWQWLVYPLLAAWVVLVLVRLLEVVAAATSGAAARCVGTQGAVVAGWLEAVMRQHSHPRGRSEAAAASLMLLAEEQAAWRRVTSAAGAAAVAEPEARWRHWPWAANPTRLWDALTCLEAGDAAAAWELLPGDA